MSACGIQAQVLLPNGTALAQGAPFRPIVTKQGGAAAVTLFVPDAGVYGEGAKGQMVSPEGGTPRCCGKRM